MPTRLAYYNCLSLLLTSLPVGNKFIFVVRVSISYYIFGHALIISCGLFSLYVMTISVLILIRHQVHDIKNLMKEFQENSTHVEGD